MLDKKGGRFQIRQVYIDDQGDVVQDFWKGTCLCVTLLEIPSGGLLHSLLSYNSRRKKGGRQEGP